MVESREDNRIRRDLYKTSELIHQDKTGFYLACTLGVAEKKAGLNTSAKMSQP
jgi:hypothetical protein